MAFLLRGLSRLTASCPTRPLPHRQSLRLANAGNVLSSRVKTANGEDFPPENAPRNAPRPSDYFSDDYTPSVEELLLHCRVTISTFLLNFNSFSNCVLCVPPSSLTNNSCGKVFWLKGRDFPWTITKAPWNRVQGSQRGLWSVQRGEPLESTCGWGTTLGRDERCFT